ncbi:MAG: AAA family ATPase [Myxococcales bacterium]|nr:AAA family ATPase [Myxococcales bacterium]
MGHHKLRRLRVYGGFLDKLDIQFADGLCCVIGGRGSGKTTVLEFIRHALDRAPRSGTPAARAAEERLKGLLAANLGPSGFLELQFESQEGLVYNIRRTAHEAPTITDAAGKPLKPEVLGSSVLVDAAIFSHNEIEDIAHSPAAQRALIDRLSSQTLQAIDNRLAQTTSLLRENAQRLVQLQVRMQGATRNLVDLSSWESKLQAATAALGGEAVSPAFKSAADHKTLREQESAALRRLRETLGKLRGILSETVPAQLAAVAGSIPESVLAGPNGPVFTALHRDILRRQNSLPVLLESPLDAIAALDRLAEQTAENLAAAHRPQDAEYTALMARAEQSSARLAARDEAAREVVRLSSAKQELQELELAIADAQADRTRLRGEFARIRGERSERRSAVAAQISDRLGGKVRVIVARDAELGPYREFLVGVMRRSGKQYNAPIERLVAQVSPAQLGALCDRGDHGALAATADINPEFAESLVRNLREQPERRFELDVLDLEDVPRIELQVHGDWRSADKLSTGQKSSAILPILLMDSEAPLLIDQPEDNLDNSFISDAVIPQLKAIRGRRQLVLLTHNPNLPVLGEAAQVIVLEADGRSSRAIAQGDVEAAKQHIVRLMEGGRDAFQQRAQRYGV